MLALDVESFMFGPGNMAPPLVCVSWASNEGAGLFHKNDPALVPFLRRGLFADSPIIGAHIAYDMAVLTSHAPELSGVVWDAYEKLKVSDVLIREKLIDLREGRGLKREYSLAAVARRRLGVELDKEGPFRRTYAGLVDTPLELWPPGAKRYAIDDAIVTRDVWLSQEEDGPIVDEREQTRAAWWLHLTTVWGITTNPMRVQSLKAKYEFEQADIRTELQSAGLIRSNGTRDISATRARIEKAYARLGESAPRVDNNPGKEISYSSDACNLSGDTVLEKLGRWGEISSKLSKDVKQMQSGIVHARYGLAESGRTTCSPNIQNLPREGGVRECYVPRPGYVFANADYDGLELRTIAQMCIDLLGRSSLADILNRGDDPHLSVAARLCALDYTEAIGVYKNKTHPRWHDINQARQAGKVANFGLPGGLGKAETLVDYARASYGVNITPKQVDDIKSAWYAAMPEMRDFFDLARRQPGMKTKTATVKQLRTGRVRGGLGFTNWCNTWFQGLGADAAKAAGYLISRECYDARLESVLLGCRIVLFCHDEFLLEVPDDARVHDAAMRLGELMCLGASKFIPDVAPKTTPFLTRCYSKMAGPVYADGRLIPWE